MNNKNGKNSLLGKICAPAMLYLVLSIIGIVWLVYAKFSTMSILLQAIFVLLWTWLLSYLCLSGYEVVSWILVLLPIVVSIIMMVMAFETIKSVVKKDIRREIRKERLRERFQNNEDDENIENTSDNQDDEKEPENM
jgi:uncharacterized membrane protein